MASRLVESAPLVVGANRDERLERPATAITVLRERRPRVLGGRDEEAGGTWLAVNEHGVVAALTNRPTSAGRDPSKRSRGELPLLLGRHTSATHAVEDFVERVRPADYNPCWLLVGDRTVLYSLDMTGGARPLAEELPAGVHILENLPLGAASAKVDHVRGLLASATGPAADLRTLSGRLRQVLADHTVPRDVPCRGDARGSTDGTGERIVHDAARHTSDPDAEAEADAAENANGEGTRQRPVETLAACVHTATYGTRSSTEVVVPADIRSPITVHVADGHPCEAPFIDVTDFWRSSP